MLEARTGKYFQVILPKDLHTAPEEIQYASLDVLTHAATLELVTSTTSQNSVVNTLELDISLAITLWCAKPKQTI